MGEDFERFVGDNIEPQQTATRPLPRPSSQQQNERERRANEVLKLALNDRERCATLWADSVAVAALDAAQLKVAEAIRNHWQNDSSGEPLTRRGFIAWARALPDLKKQELGRLELAFNAVQFSSAKLADWEWMLTALRADSLHTRYLAILKRIDPSDANAVSEAKAINADYVTQRITVADALARMEALAAPATATVAATDDCGARVVCLADVQPTAVEWLWQNRLPLGKLVLISGDPGLGKSTLTLDCVARVTTGAAWADGSPCSKGKAIIVTAEDDLSDTIRPRLEAAGADVTSVFAIEMVRDLDRNGKPIERTFTLADLPQLESVIRQHRGVKLVVIDPVSAFLNGTDSHRDSDIRQLLTPLTKLAAEHRVCVMLVTHLNKSGGKGKSQALYRSMGSIGIAGAARAAYLVCRDPKDNDRRLMLPTKNNLAPETGGLAFHLADGPRVIWSSDAVAMTADEALSESDSISDPQRSEAKDMLRELLSAGAVSADECFAAARANGISEATLKRAKSELKVVAAKSGFGSKGRWTWALPKAGAVADADEHEDPAAWFDSE